MTIIIAIWLLFCLLACNPEKITTETDKDGVIRQLPHGWKSSNSNVPFDAGLHRGFLIELRGVLAMGVCKSPKPNARGERS
jgi:hypothetical protein